MDKNKTWNIWVLSLEDINNLLHVMRNCGGLKEVTLTDEQIEDVVERFTEIFNEGVGLWSDWLQDCIREVIDEAETEENGEENKMTNIGKVLYGYCNGYFGNDSHHDKIIEAEGDDWVVARDVTDKMKRPEFARFSSSATKDLLIQQWGKSLWSDPLKEIRENKGK